MEIFKNIATVVGCISACIALLITIIKPLRQRFVDSIAHKSQYQNMVSNIESLSKKLDESLTNDAKIQARLERVEKNVLENEADRIRTELFDCGNRCRRGIRLHPEEMDHIRASFHKYSSVLHQNHDGEAEFNFILDYYNHQDFPEYHKLNNKMIGSDLSEEN